MNERTAGTNGRAAQFVPAVSVHVRPFSVPVRIKGSRSAAVLGLQLLLTDHPLNLFDGVIDLHIEDHLAELLARPARVARDAVADGPRRASHAHLRAVAGGR